MGLVETSFGRPKFCGVQSHSTRHRTILPLHQFISILSNYILSFLLSILSSDISLVMGIPYLTKHLLPYADSVLLSGESDDQKLDETPQVRSVVIDGPSLVYHVYYRLLAWMSPVHDVLDVQPTCNEVSRAVVTCLLELNRLGIKM